MPFAGYGSFDECVAQNGDKASPQGFCAWLEHETTGRWPGEMVASLPEHVQTAFWRVFGDDLAVGKPHDVALQSAKQVAEEAGYQVRNGRWLKVAEHRMATRSVVNVQIFAAGEHNGESYTMQDLDSMVVAFHELKGRIDPPLKIGHTSDEFNRQLAEDLGVPYEIVGGENGQGAMALGWITALRREVNVLVADFSDVPVPIADLIESRGYAKVSAEILFNVEDRGKAYPKVLSATALLGAELPAVREIDGLEKAAVYTTIEKPNVVVEFAVSEEGLTYEEFEPSLQAVEDAMEGVIKGMRGARILRALWTDVKHKVRTMFDKKHSEGRKSTEAFSASNNEEVEMKEVATMLGLAEDATLEQVLAAITDLMARTKELQSSEPKKLQLNEVAVLLGLAEDATLEQVLAAITDLMAKAETGGVEAKAEFADLKARLKTTEEDLASQKRKGRVAHYTQVMAGLKAIEGKPDELAEEITQLEETSKEMAERFVARLKDQNRQLEAAGILKTKGTATEGEVGDDHQFVKEMRTYAEEKHVDEATAQAAIRKSNPDLYKAYMRERKLVKKEA